MRTRTAYSHQAWDVVDHWCMQAKKKLFSKVGHVV